MATAAEPEPADTEGWRAAALTWKAEAEALRQDNELLARSSHAFVRASARLLAAEESKQAELQTRLREACDKCVLSTFHEQLEQAPQRVCRSPEDVTVAWMSSVFNSEVASFEMRVCSEGQLGLTLVLHDIKYTDAGAARPKSVALKMHALGEEQRSFARDATCHAREVWFYTQGRGLYPGKSPTPLFISTDGSSSMEFFNIMMQDLNVEWTPFGSPSSADSTSFEDMELLFHSQILPMHVEFWGREEALALRPLSRTATRFSDLYGLPAMIDDFEDSWRQLKQHFPTKAGWPGGAWPSEMGAFVGLVDELAAEDGKLMRVVWDGACDIMDSRPQTLVHGDMNPGNIWRGRADAQQLLVADWQMVKMGPAAIDFFTPLCTTDVDSQRLMRSYHDALCAAVPGAAATYPLDQLNDDLCLVVATFMVFLTCVQSAQLVPGALPPDKEAFTWQEFWPTIYKCLVKVWTVHGLDAVVRKVLSGEYKNFGVRHR